MASKFVSRGGDKLDFALEHLKIDVAGLVAADLGSNVGGFVDCLLQHGAARVYSVDTSYGTLAWKLRQDKRVVVMERTNALHAELPEKVDLVTIDVAWTKQALVLPHAISLVKPGGRVLSLLKPQYEAADGERVKGIVPLEFSGKIAARVVEELKAKGIVAKELVPLPEPDKRNQEYFLLIEVV